MIARPQDPTPSRLRVRRPAWWLVLIKVVAVFVFLVVMTLFAIVYERKVVGRMQERLGPNRVGPFGSLQSLADGMKLAFKEEIIPIAGRQAGLLPRADHLGGPRVHRVLGDPVRADGLDLRPPDRRCSSPTCRSACWWSSPARRMGVYGIVLSGWASGSTYPLLGGLRSAAQMISYEVAMGLSIVAVFMTAGTHVDLGHRARSGSAALASAGTTSDLVRGLLSQLRDLRDLRRRRDQPGPVRPARGRVRAGRRLPHRVLVDQVRAVLPGRVHQHGHRLGAGHHAVPRRLAGAVADLAVVTAPTHGWWPLLWFIVKVLIAAVRASSGCAARCPGCATTSSCASAGRCCSRSTWSGSWPLAGDPRRCSDRGWPAWSRRRCSSSAWSSWSSCCWS